MDIENIDLEKLREYLKNYFGMAYLQGFYVALGELVRVQNANDKELIQIAEQNNINFNDFIKSKKR